MTTTPMRILDSLSRVRLAHLPTPVEPLPNLSKYPGRAELWIKQAGPATGANKARKLEYLLGISVGERKATSAHA